MKLQAVLVIGSLVAFGLFAQSPEEKEYEAWMKATGATVGSLRKNVEGKAADGAAADAQKLAEIFKQVEGFWAKRQTEDAVKRSREAQAAAGEVASAAKAGNWEGTGSGLKGLMSTCAACHAAHREKLPEGGYKIKQ